MTRKKFNKLSRTLSEKIQCKYTGKHLTGDVLRFYRNREHRIGSIKFDSYAEAWEALKPARDCVGM